MRPLEKTLQTVVYKQQCLSQIKAAPVLSSQSNSAAMLPCALPVSGCSTAQVVEQLASNNNGVASVDTRSIFASEVVNSMSAESSTASSMSARSLTGFFVPPNLDDGDTSVVSVATLGMHGPS